MKRSFERHVRHRPEQMFALVADLARYPDFIPNCSAMEVSPAPGAGADTVLAKMTISFGPITQAYTSRVRMDEQRLSIGATAVDGPFRHLDSLWRFLPEGAGTKVLFEIDFRISNPVLALAAEPAFASKQEEIVEAFLARADRLYA